VDKLVRYFILIDISLLKKFLLLLFEAAFFLSEARTNGCKQRPKVYHIPIARHFFIYPIALAGELNSCSRKRMMAFNLGTNYQYQNRTFFSKYFRLDEYG